MLRLLVKTQYDPQQVITRATGYFAQGLGMEARPQSDTCVTFTGGGGYVTVTAEAGEGGRGSQVTLETREWEYDTQRFAQEIG
ncbi:MAG: hypothetical protein ACOYEW_00195 [Anaerolineae bacterium]|jgi:glycerate-2-kinase